MRAISILYFLNLFLIEVDKFMLCEPVALKPYIGTDFCKDLPIINS